MKYRWLAFLSKVALICNVCSLIMIFTANWFNALPVFDFIQRTIVILGVLAVLLNIALQVILFVMRVTKKEAPVPAWIRIFNAAAFAIQIIYYLVLTGKTS